MEEATIDQSLNTKNVFTSALRFAMSIDTLKNSPELVHELKTSAQEQVEFMLSEDEEVRLLVSQEEVRSFILTLSGLIDGSNEILMVAQNCKLDSRILSVKMKLVEVTWKVLEAVGYGIVIVPSRSRACLLKIWLPFIRRLLLCFLGLVKTNT
ncbi:unnamed protein product [Arabis nemorensis]|uniref:Uncharacterized protein n=1 Tax=Arabis nemorensis TaxID=586526 RepID=A0A565C3H1_9BRAS|nr:unnamed protein product [Arabis nemorensis]